MMNTLFSASDDLRNLTGGFAVLRQEYFLSRVGGLLDRIEELNPDEVAKLKEVIALRYDSITDCARGKAPIETKRVAIQCAKILGNEGDFLDLGYDAFCAGDIGSLFDSLEHLYDSGNIDRARALIAHVYRELGNNQLYSDDSSSEVKKELLGSLAIYAFRFDYDDIANEIVQLLEGGLIASDDPRILKYRRVVRTPEEFKLAVREIWDLFRLGLSQNVSIHLLEAVHVYAKNQIQYLNSNQVIEPEMMKFLTEDFELAEDKNDDDEVCDYTTMDGKNYFSCRLYYILAIIYQDEYWARHLVSLLEENDDYIGALTADITDKMDSHLVPEDSPVLSVDQAIYHRVLVLLLRVYQGIEYGEIHGCIYRLMKYFDPFNGPLTIIEHQSQTLSRLYHFQSIPGLAQHYNELVKQINFEQGNIARIHILDRVLAKDELVQPQTSIATIYYALEYILLYGVAPQYPKEVIIHMYENIPLSQIEQSFLVQFYPQYFSE